MEHDYKEVYYGQYCKTCKHKDVEEKDEPCNECLDTPIRPNSHRPINWVKNSKKKTK